MFSLTTRDHPRVLLLTLGGGGAQVSFYRGAVTDQNCPAAQGDSLTIASSHTDSLCGQRTRA